MVWVMIAAVVLAAGKSERMGTPKMGLPWGETTVIGQVVTTLLASQVDEVVVVTGGGGAEVESALRRLPEGLSVRSLHNPDYAAGEMLSSLRAGISALGEDVDATLVALGDQPQIEGRVVSAILTAYRQGGAGLVVPSYNMRRGHPMLIARSLWSELLSLRSPQTLRELLLAHSGEIHYVNVDTPTILQDLDTPADYQQYKP